MNIEKWLAGLGLEKYGSTFLENEIDLESVLLLSADELQSLIPALGPRKKLLAALEQLRLSPVQTQGSHAVSSYSPFGESPSDSPVPSSLRSGPLSQLSDDLILIPSEISMGSEIGRGAFGIVHVGIYRSQPVAIKRLQRAALREVENFHREIHVMSCLRSPYAVLFMGVCDTGSDVLIVTEFMDHGSLDSFCSSPAGKSLPILLRVRMALDIARGLAHLHGNHPAIIHRDLTAMNVLVDRDFKCKVADFGMSRWKDGVSSMTALPGNLRWMAPEVLQRQSYDEQADIFSLSLVLWQLFSNQLPLSDLDPAQAASKMAYEGVRPLLSESYRIPLEISQLIRDGWSQTPSLRPRIGNIVKTLAEVYDRLKAESKLTSQPSTTGSMGEYSELSLEPSVAVPQSVENTATAISSPTPCWKDRVWPVFVGIDEAFKSTEVDSNRPVANIPFLFETKANKLQLLCLEVCQLADNTSVVVMGTDACEIVIADPQTGSILEHFQPGCSSRVTSAAAAGPGRCLIGTGDEVQEIDLDKRRVVQTYRRTKSVFMVSLSADAREIISVGEGGILMFDRKTGKKTGHNSSCVSYAACMSPDKSMIALTSRYVYIYCASGVHKLELMAQVTASEQLTSIAFSPDGRYLASGGSSCGCVLMWNVETDLSLTHKFTFHDHSWHTPYPLVFHPTRPLLLVGMDEDALLVRFENEGKVTDRWSPFGRRFHAKFLPGDSDMLLLCSPLTRSFTLTSLASVLSRPFTERFREYSADFQEIVRMFLLACLRDSYTQELVHPEATIARLPVELVMSVLQKLAEML